MEGSISILVIQSHTQELAVGLLISLPLCGFGGFLKRKEHRLQHNYHLLHSRTISASSKPTCKLPLWVGAGIEAFELLIVISRLQGLGKQHDNKILLAQRFHIHES